MPQRKAKVKSKAIQKRPVRHRKPAPQQAMVVRAPGNKPWQLTLDEVALVKNHVAKGATDKELEFCLAVARRRKLDPFKGQIWFVKRRDQSAEGGHRWIPITGIDGLCHVAARDHRDYGSNDEPEYGPMATVTWQWQGKGEVKKLQAPEWAKVAVWKKGATRPTVATVWWNEIYPNIDFAPTVREKPRLMLGKCALAQAIRRAYPDTGGLYIPEEFQGPPEFTPGGRVIEQCVIVAMLFTAEDDQAVDGRIRAGTVEGNIQIVARQLAAERGAMADELCPARNGHRQCRDRKRLFPAALEPIVINPTIFFRDDFRDGICEMRSAPADKTLDEGQLRCAFRHDQEPGMRNGGFHPGSRNRQKMDRPIQLRAARQMHEQSIRK